MTNGTILIFYAGKINLDGDEFSVSNRFQEDTIIISEELDLDELRAARLVFDSQEDESMLGRSLVECVLIRYHQQRKYVLDILRLFLDVDEDDDEEEESSALESMRVYVENRLLQPATGAKGYNTRCLSAMAEIREALQKVGDRLAAAQNLVQHGANPRTEEVETIEFARVSLIQQHELLGAILARCVEKRQTSDGDFIDYVNNLKKIDKYDALLGKLSDIFMTTAFLTALC